MREIDLMGPRGLTRVPLHPARPEREPGDPPILEPPRTVMVRDGVAYYVGYVNPDSTFADCAWRLADAVREVPVYVPLRFGSA